MLKEPIAGCALGKYDLLSQIADGAPYRLSHPLAQYVLRQALALDTSKRDAEIHFDAKASDVNVRSLIIYNAKPAISFSQSCRLIHLKKSNIACFPLSHPMATSFRKKNVKNFSYAEALKPPSVQFLNQ